MNKKKLLSLALVVIMIATLSFSSLAWFTDKDSAENKFNIGGAGTGDSDDIFDVEVKENVDGEEDPVDSWDYEDILPGDKLKKEAFITNEGAYDQYIRVVMTVTDWELIKNVVTINMDDAFDTYWHIFGGQAGVKDDVLFDYANTELVNGNLVVTMYLNKKLEPGETVNIMDYVEISKNATQENFADEAFEDGFQITFDADAAQTENILTSLDDREWYNAMKTFEALAAEN